MSMLSLFTLGGSGVEGAVTPTTYCAVRDQIIATLNAATPSVLSAYKFDHAPKHLGARRFATTAGDASLRRFDLRRRATDTTSYFAADVVERTEVVVLTVTYPVAPGIYGRDDWDDVDKVMRSDVRQIRDLVTSAGNFVGQQSIAQVRALEPERDGPVWRQQFEITVLFIESSDLT